MTLLPKPIQNTPNIALENCMQEAFNINPKDIMLNPLESIKPEFLPFLAKEYHVMGWEGWNLAETKQEKQNLIINSLTKHAKKGSIPAIKEILKDFNIEADVNEFWEYGGRPAHYSIKFLNLYDRGLTDEFREILYKIIRAYAPKTRVLDYVNYFLCSRTTVYISSRTKVIKKLYIRGAVNEL